MHCPKCGARNPDTQPFCGECGSALEAANIAERQGDRALARERFRTFLELWKDADPGQPEMADARRRLITS